MSISEVSIRRPVLAWMLMAALIVFGAISFTRMGISQMPDVNFPVVNISLRLDNAAPEVMETNVVDIIEDAVMGIEGLTRITSNVSQGVANITCEFKMDHNIDVALQEVQNRITQAQNQLPTALYPPVISKTNPEDQPIMWALVSADDTTPLYEEMIYARNVLKDQLSTISGVGNVTFAGFVEPNLRIWLNTKKLRSYDLTSTDILSAIQSEQIEQPAGRIEAQFNETNIRVLGEAKSAEDFGKIRINNRGGAPNYNPIPISEVSRIEEGLSDIRAISRFNGKRAVGLGIVKQHGANAVEVSRLVQEKVKTISHSLPKGYHVDVKLDTTDYIRESVHELNFALLLAAIFTSIVCYLFLGSWSSTLNVLLAIPTSIVGAFTALYFMGFTLNSFTLLGLSLAIGIVVDDAIMMLENIVRHFEMKKTRRQAALDGSNEITFAALATTVAIAAIFIPVIFMKGVIGRFFFQYGVTVTVAVFLSLLEALTLTPMRCARFLETSEHSSKLARSMDSLMATLANLYQRSLAWCLNRRFVTISASIFIFVLSLVLMKTLNKELIPPQDQSLFLLNIKAPVGKSIEYTDRVFRKAEEELKANPNVRDVYTTIGNYQSNNIVNAGTIYVILKPAKERKLSQQEVMREVQHHINESLNATFQTSSKLDSQNSIEVFTQDLSITGFSASRGFPIEFTLEGPDWTKLKTYYEQIISTAQKTGLVENINSDYQDGMPQIVITPDRNRAAQRGVSVTSMGQEVANIVGGQLFSANTEYPKDDHRYYIRMRADQNEFKEAKDIERIGLRNNRGATELVSLKDVANIEVVKAPQLISRVNRMRAIPVYANIVQGKSQQEAIEAIESIARKILPPGYKLNVIGSAQAFREAFNSLIFALILGIIVAYMVLASQFNSFVHPITILVALPFSLSGALIALFLTHQSISLFSMIGLILLMGIVKKNSILLVDFTNQKRKSGASPHSALLEACPVRLRPILMTSVATVAGAIPEALNFGAGAETRVPMAISIIGGVTLSTLLTLYVVPCVYSYFTKLEQPEEEDFELNENTASSKGSL